MREIKFRMWSNGKMYYRNLTDRNWYFTEANDENGCNTAFGAIPENINNPIMQYTGFKDKNGKRIFSGDIILVDEWGLFDKIDLVDGKYKGKAEVLFKYGSWGLEINKYGDFMTINGRVCEIIGNVYEDPEIIKQLTPTGCQKKRDQNAFVF